MHPAATSQFVPGRRLDRGDRRSLPPGRCSTIGMRSSASSRSTSSASSKPCPANRHEPRVPRTVTARPSLGAHDPPRVAQPPSQRSRRRPAIGAPPQPSSEHAPRGAPPGPAPARCSAAAGRERAARRASSRRSTRTHGSSGSAPDSRAQRLIVVLGALVLVLALGAVQGRRPPDAARAGRCASKAPVNGPARETCRPIAARSSIATAKSWRCRCQRTASASTPS